MQREAKYFFKEYYITCHEIRSTHTHTQYQNM